MTVATSLLLAVLLSVGALSALWYLEDHLKRMIFSQQSSMVSAVADQLDDKLRAAQTELAALSQEISPAVAADPAQAARVIAARRDVLATFGSGVSLFSPRGDVIAAVPVDHSPPDDAAFRSFLRKAAAGRNRLVAHPYLSSREGAHPMVIFAEPVVGEKGEVVAILGGSLDLYQGNFLGKLASVKLGGKGYLHLIDSAGRYLVHPDPQMMLQLDVPPGKNPLLGAAGAGSEGTGDTTDARGGKVISSFKRLPSTGWVLAGNLPQSEAYAPVYRAQRYLFVALVLALALSVLGVSLCTNHLVAPLLSVTDQVRALSAGENEAGVRIPVQEEGNEIGVLAEAFNRVLLELDAQKAELRRQLRFSRALVETIPFPLYYKDVNGVFLGCNKAFERAHGLTWQELAGKTIFDLQPPHLAEVCRNADRELLRDQGVQMYETPAYFADGLLHDIIVHKGVLPAADGTPGGIVGTLLDISERKRAEAAHEKTRRQMQLILDAVEEGIFGVDLAGRVTFINPAAAGMMGRCQEELLGAHQHSILHHTKVDGSEYPAHQCPIYATFRDGVARHVSDEVFWRKDGTSFPVQYTSSPIVEDGTLVGAVVTFSDITERKRAEEQLMMLSQALMQSPVGVVITDTAGKIEFVNPRIGEATGYRAEEVIGQTPRLFQSGQTSREVYASLWDTIRSGRVWSSEIYNRKKSGECFWERATIFPVRNISGDITNFMAFKEDISEQKKLEAQLRHSQKMEAVGQFAGGVAHDFNNILTVITGFGELLHNSLPQGDARRRHMEQILSAAGRASHLTGSLLAFSRKQIMLLVPTDLQALGSKLVHFLSRIIGEDVTLETEFGEEPLVVLADGGQIEQVLMNLATNARDAMPGGGKLRIRLQRVQLDRKFCRSNGLGSPGPHVLLTVSDTGTGMEEEVTKKIFEPFFTTKETGRGTGLGLSIVYGIVKQHNGYICVSSERGAGTTFSVYLPEIAPSDGEEQEVPLPHPRGGEETILLAEDDAAVRTLVETVLAEFGYRVIVACDGQEAVDLYCRHAGEIDLAMFDVIMPRKSGKEACDELRSVNPELKVLLLSGYTADMIQDRGILVDGVELVLKPVQATVLARKVREMLDS